METIINKEYQDMIDSLSSILEEENDIRNADMLEEVIQKLKHFGSRPKLNPQVQAFNDLAIYITKIYADKNHDYGNSFEQSMDEFGLTASAVRMGDKMNRFKSLIKKDSKVKDESMKDTLLDLACYAIMTIMWLNKNK